MDLNHAFLLLTTVFTLYKPSSQDVSFLISRTKIKDASGEQHKVTVQGNGIDTEVKLKYYHDFHPLLMIPGGFLLGNPLDDLVSVFTDTADSLIVMMGPHTARTCVHRSPEYHGVELKIDLLPEKCDELLDTMLKYWRDYEDSGGVTNSNINGEIYVVKTKRKETEADACLGSVRISGHGVDHTLGLACAAVDSVEAVFLPQGVMVRGAGTGLLYIADHGQLVTIEDHGCQRRLFGRYEQRSNASEAHMPFKTATVSERECSDFRETVMHYLTYPPADIRIKRLDHYTENNVTFQEFHIEGNGVVEKVSFPERTAQSMQLLYMPGGFALGDWEGRHGFVYSASLDTLVQVTPQKCEQTTYKAGREVGRRQVDCRGQLRKMAGVWRNVGREEAENGFTVHRHSYDRNDRCVQDIMVEGRGVEYRLTATCEAGNRMETIFTDWGVVVGDYRRDVQSVVVKGVMVFIVYKQQCKQHFYTAERSRVDDVEAEECRRIKRKVDTAVERHNSGYLVALEKRNKEFRITRETTNKHKENCHQDIHLSGNGIIEVVKASCKIADDLNLFFLHEGFMLGYRISILAVSPGSLAIIHRDRSCEGRAYNVMESVEKTPVPVNAEECEALNRFVDVTWNSKRSGRYWSRIPTQQSPDDPRNKMFIKVVRVDRIYQRKNRVSIKGNGVYDDVPFRMQDDTTTLSVEGRFILGNFLNNSKYIYNDEPKTLVVVRRKNNAWKCWKRTYTGQDKSEELMGDIRCNRIHLEIENTWCSMNDKQHKESVAISEMKGINVVKRMTTTKDGCNGSLTVQGDGIDSSESVDCNLLESMKVLFTSTGVVVGDPARTPVTFFNDKTTALVLVKNGNCYKTKYAVSTTLSSSGALNIPKYKTTTASMGGTACSEIKGLINAYWDNDYWNKEHMESYELKQTDKRGGHIY